VSRLAIVVLLLVAPVRAAGGEGATVLAGPREVSVPQVEMRLIEAGKSHLIDLSTALALAGAKNLEILMARTRVGEAHGARNEAYGRLVPEYGGSFTARRIDGRIQASFGELDRKAFTTLIPAATVELELNPGRALFDALAARRSLAAAEQDAEQVTQDVLATVARQYLALQDGQAGVKIAEEALVAARELARLARDRERGGGGLKIDALRAEARVAADEVRLARARRGLRAASIELAVALELDPAVMLFPLETVVREHTLVDPTLPLDTLIARAVAGRPDLAGEIRRVKAAESTHRATWAEAVGPSVYGSIEESAIGPSVGDLGNREIYGGFLRFRFSPAAIGRVQAAEARLAQARLRAERLEQVVSAEVVGAREEAETAREQIDAALRGLRAAEAAFELSQVRFKGGVGIGLEVLDAQAALAEARTNLVGAIVGYDVSQVRLLRAVGAVSPEALLERHPHNLTRSD
jgi:outer membrane protein TolC